VTLEEVLSQVPPTRLETRDFIDTSPVSRIIHAVGQSVPDWLRLRYGKIDVFPDGVSFPSTGEQVRELLAFAAANDLVVIPYGGGTSVVGHLSSPRGSRPVLIVSTSKLSKLTSLNRLALLATFGSGVSGPSLEAQLHERGFTLGHFPQSFEFSTLGGWVATRSSGQQSLAYGRIEQLFAGGQLETPAGTLEIPTFPASATGIDLRELVLGSEGRIGILTEATVRIRPIPKREEFHAFFFPNWEYGENAVRAMAQARLPLSMLRFSNSMETSTTLALGGHATMIGWLNKYLRARGCGAEKTLLLVGFSGDSGLVSYALKRVLRMARSFKGVRTGRPIGNKWKTNRFRNAYLRNTLWQHGYVVDTAETAVDWPRARSVSESIEQAAKTCLAKHNERVLVYTHLSHVYPQGTSVYSTFVYRLTGEFEADLSRWEDLKGSVSEAIVSCGGTISHHHGVGTLHAPYLQTEKGVLGIGAMRSLFSQFDPIGIMNPGKLLPPDRSE
jgi:alkyldihydroxyacetonephosphate synthase